MTESAISITARLAAYMRQFTDIPFAADVARLLQAREAFDTLLSDSGMSPDDLLWYAPIFEARYKSIAAAIRNSGITQVLELASGVSLRGLAMTNDLAFTYVETDLPDITAEKIGLVSELRRAHRLPDYGNHHLIAANALSIDDLRAAITCFRRDLPIAVVNEGLFQYLSTDEMETVARNISGLLAIRGGLWMTPDFSIKGDVRNVTEQQRRFRAIVTAATDRPMYNNAFDTIADLNAFLKRAGLKGRSVNQLGLTPRLVSPEALHLPQALPGLAGQALNLWLLSAA